MKQFIVITAIILGGCAEQRRISTFSYASQLQGIIVDSRTSLKAAVDAYSKLDKLRIDENPMIWATAIKDPHLTHLGKALSFQCLFRRFARPPMSFNSFVKDFQIQPIGGEIVDENRGGGYPFTLSDVFYETGKARGVDLWCPGSDPDDCTLGVWLLFSRVISVDELKSVLSGNDSQQIEVLKVQTLDGLKLKKLWGFTD